MSRYLTISEAAQLKGVSPDTLRRWEKEDKIQSIRTDGGHRRYLASEVLAVEGDDTKMTVCYARVSTPDKKSELEIQASVLQGYSEAQGWGNITVIKDLGSGLNYKNRGLRKLIELIESDQVERLVLTHLDRLLREACRIDFYAL